MIVAQKENIITKINNKKYILLLGASIIVTMGAIVLKYIGQNMSSQTLMNISDAVSGTLFALIVYLIVMKLKICNKILNFLGKISYEFYLLHGLAISFISKFTGPEKPIIFCFVSLISIILAATAVNFIQRKFSFPIVKRIR